jgi:hypothetical protein
VPITRLLQKALFGPDEIAVMVAAFEGALRELPLDRAHPAAEIRGSAVREQSLVAPDLLREP